MGKFPWKLVACMLLITGCTKMCGNSHAEMSAEEVVEAYLDLALNMTSVDQRDQLLELTTGGLGAAIAAASVETIQKAYVDRKYNLKKYSLMERRDRTPKETEITYELTYNELNGEKNPESAPLVKTENTVAVVKEKGAWYIRDILGNKTSIEFPVTDLNTILAKPGVITDPSLGNE